MTNIRGAQSYWRTFRTPTVLAVLSIVGLISALVGDGSYDIVSWLTLALPLIAVYVSLRRSKRA